MKIWKPDTCGCEIEEVYNGTDIVGGGQVLKKCVAHAGVADNELYGVLYSNPDGENKRKNHLYRTLLGMEEVNGLALDEVKKDEKGKDVGVGLKEGLEYEWSFSGTGKDRILTATVKGTTIQKTKKDSIKAHCDSKFGVGKVIFD